MKTAIVTIISWILGTSTVSAFVPPTVVPQGQQRFVSSLREGEDDNDFRGAEAISSLTKDVHVVFTSEQVDEILPHRFPFALVDKVVEFEAGKRAVGLKAVTKNEEFFQGHFPGQPVMPGVLQVEALAQLAGVCCLKSEGVKEGSIFLFAGVDGVKWKKPVTPGDMVVMEVEITKFNAKFGIAKATGKSYVNGALTVEVGEMTFAIAK
jgi:3-hydroxyacyl-[acyl-carrier-protein] dehydratase